MNTHEKCCAQVHNGGRSCGFHQCCNRGILTRDGKPYCKIHDPVAVAAKYKARLARWDAENKAKSEQWARQDAAIASYAKHCGPKARELAEADLLGKALDLLRECCATANFPKTIGRVHALLEKLPK